MEGKDWVIIFLLLQLIGGIVLLIKVWTTWNRMRKLKTLIIFMKKLLILLLLRSFALIGEIIYELDSKKGDDYKGSDLNIWIHDVTEFINWTLTQLVIWVVSMRFYESSLPIKRLEKTMKRSEECGAPPEKLWLEDRSSRNCFSLTSMTIATVSTALSMSFLTLYEDLSNDTDEDAYKRKTYLVLSYVFFAVVFFMQSIAVVLMIMAYQVIKKAAITLGL